MDNRGRRAVGLVLAALAANLLVNEAVPGAHLAAGLGLAACLLAIARAGGLAAADLGLARSALGTGLRWGERPRPWSGRATPWPGSSRACARPSPRVTGTSAGWP